MIGRLYIDGNDAYLKYGVCVSESGWNELIAMPPLKAVEYNDWQEEDGIEPDLSEPVLNTREISIVFITQYYNTLFHSLMELLSDGAYHVFDCVSIKRKYTLRLTGLSHQDVMGELATVILKFADDFPLKDYNYLSPVKTISTSDPFSFDDIPLSDYNVRILEGTLSEITKDADVKTNMLRNIKSQSGAVYDPKTVTYKAKDVKLYCFMTADDLVTLWRNYDALLYNLTRPNERTLFSEILEQEFQCYYKSCQVTEFYPNDKIWLEFTLTMSFIGDFRIIDDGSLLSSEDGILIFTQTGDNAIDMQSFIYTNPTCRFVNDAQHLRLSGNGTFRFND